MVPARELEASSGHCCVVWAGVWVFASQLVKRVFVVEGKRKCHCRSQRRPLGVGLSLDEAKHVAEFQGLNEALLIFCQGHEGENRECRGAICENFLTPAGQKASRTHPELLLNLDEPGTEYARTSTSKHAQMHGRAHARTTMDPRLIHDADTRAHCCMLRHLTHVAAMSLTTFMSVIFYSWCVRQPARRQKRCFLDAKHSSWPSPLCCAWSCRSALGAGPNLRLELLRCRCQHAVPSDFQPHAFLHTICFRQRPSP